MQKSRFSFRVNLCFGLAASVLIFWLLIHVPQIFEDFLQNIIWSGAYIGIAKGLAVTLLLTVTGVLLGTLFGIIFCTFRNSRILALNIFGQALIEILRGTPVVMLLMFLYFCVFINLKIEALMVAMIGYGLNSGAHMAEIFRTSLDAVNTKETEAARMFQK